MEIMKQFGRCLLINSVVVLAALTAFMFVYAETTGLWPTSWFL